MNDKGDEEVGEQFVDKHLPREPSSVSLLTILMVQPLKRGSLRKRIVTHLYDAILQGELHPGERIVEGKLARQLGVAQASLREALQELEHQGLVTKQDNRGTFVVQLTAADVENMYVVRQELEPLAAKFACERLTPDHLAQMVSMVDRMNAAGSKGDFVELLKTDLDFHRFIWRLSGNSSIERALNAVCPPLFASYLMRVARGSTYNQAKDVEEHRALVSAFKHGSPEKAEKVFQGIMETFRIQDVQNLRSVSEGGETSMAHVVARGKKR